MMKAATRIVLPHFKESGKPFVLLFWSRDPDKSASTTPGTASASMIRASTDPAARPARATPTPCWANCWTRLKATGPGQDHRCLRHRRSRLRHRQPCQRHQPLGAFRSRRPVICRSDSWRSTWPPSWACRCARPGDRRGAGFQQRRQAAGGSGMLGRDPAHPDVVVAPNGGSDLIYLPGDERQGQPRRRHRQFPPQPGLCQRHFRQ